MAWAVPLLPSVSLNGWLPSFPTLFPQLTVSLLQLQLCSKSASVSLFPPFFMLLQSPLFLLLFYYLYIYISKSVSGGSTPLLNSMQFFFFLIKTPLSLALRIEAVFNLSQVFVLHIQLCPWDLPMLAWLISSVCRIVPVLPASGHTGTVVSHSLIFL